MSNNVAAEKLRVFRNRQTQTDQRFQRAANTEIYCGKYRYIYIAYYEMKFFIICTSDGFYIQKIPVLACIKKKQHFFFLNHNTLLILNFFPLN